MRLFFFLLLLAVPAGAQEIFTPGGGPPSLEAGVGYGGDNGTFYRESSFKASSPLGKPGPWSLRASLNAANLRSFNYGYFPGDLYRIGANVSAKNGKFSWALGARSNSDRPFGSPDTADLSADLTYAISTGTHRLLAGVNFSTQRSFWKGLPFPYLLYSYMSNNVQFALPFFLRVKLEDRWWLTMVYIPVRNGRAAIRYAATAGTYTELEFYSRLEQYLPYGRSDKTQRLYRYSSAASLKQSFPLARNLSAEVTAGYAFSNRYYSGGQYNDVNAAVSLGPCPFAGLALKFIP